MIEDLFKAHVLIGAVPELTPWEEIELYRVFNNGHLPTDPLHTSRNVAAGGGGIKLSTISARALMGRR